VRPSLLIGDLMAWWAIDAAMTAEIPFVLSVPCTPSAMYIDLLPWGYPLPGSGLPRHPGVAGQVRNALYSQRIKAAAILRTPAIAFGRHRKKMGLSNSFFRGPIWIRSARAVFAYSIFGLEYPFPAPGRLELLGPMIPPEAPRPPDDLDAWLDRHPSVVFISLGTLVRLDAGHVAAIAGAIERLGERCQVLWKLPRAQQELLGRRPANLRVEDWVPSQLDVLRHPHVRAFVTHGGGNGFHEGLHFGKPLYVLPFWFDCFDFAARAVESGVGLAPARAPRFTTEELADGITRLLDEPRFAEAARHWSKLLRAAGGVQRAADLATALAAS
jgi:polyene glycosyltransferase